MQVATQASVGAAACKGTQAAFLEGGWIKGVIRTLREADAAHRNGQIHLCTAMHLRFPALHSLEAAKTETETAPKSTHLLILKEPSQLFGG